MLPVKGFFVCALVAALGTGGCANDDTRPARHVVVLGLDAGTWDLLGPLIARGVLPNLTWLRDHGTTAPLHAPEPRVAPAIWTGIATGKSSQKHGITALVSSERAGAVPRPVIRAMRRGKALWEILGQSGFDVAVVGWAVTYPVEELNGRMVSDRAHLGARDARAVFPSGYLTGLAMPGADEAKAALAGVSVSDRIVTAWIRDAYYLRAAERVLEDGSLPRALALQLRGVGTAQPLPGEAAVLGDQIERYWQWIDAAVGRILGYYVDSSRIVLVVSGSPRDDGIFIAEGPGVRAGATLAHASIEDVAPTLLYYLGMPAGADMDGVLLEGLFTGTAAAARATRIATYDEPLEQDAGLDPAPEGDASDEAVLEELRSLGYFD